MPTRAGGADGPDDHHGPEAGEAGSKNHHIPWAVLLKRVFRVDVLVCPRRQGRMTVLSAVMEAHAATAILNHLGLDAKPPPLSSPRARPETLDEIPPPSDWDGIDIPAPSWDGC